MFVKAVIVHTQIARVSHFIASAPTLMNIVFDGKPPAFPSTASYAARGGV